jgi:hypothetical protein
MKKLITASVFLLMAAPALAGEDSTHRYWGYGPAWYDIPCGLACFSMWERSGLEAGDVNIAQLKRVRTIAEMRLLIDTSGSRIAGRDAATREQHAAEAKQRATDG